MKSYHPHMIKKVTDPSKNGDDLFRSPHRKPSKSKSQRHSTKSQGQGQQSAKGQGDYQPPKGQGQQQQTKRKKAKERLSYVTRGLCCVAKQR
jgi:hypothetical protein